MGNKRLSVVIAAAFLAQSLAGSSAAQDEPTAGVDGQERSLAFLQMLVGRHLGLAAADASQAEADVRMYAKNDKESLRLAGAYRVRLLPEAKREEIARPLLPDADLVIRRVAAESLWGARALEPATAEQHGYARVLDAERKAQELFAALPGSDLRTQYELTRKAAALGRDLDWFAIEHLLDRDPLVAFAAGVVWTQLQSQVPEWEAAVRKRLKQRGDWSLNTSEPKEVEAEFERITGVPLILKSTLFGTHVRYDEADKDAMGLLRLLTKKTQCDWSIHQNAVCFKLPAIADGMVPVFLDVRDIEAAGFREDWRAWLRRDKATAEFVDAVGSFGEPMDYHGGVLLIWAAVLDTPRQDVAPVVKRLNKLRKSLDLKAEPWPIEERK